MKKIVYCIFITIFMLSCEHTADLQIMKTAEQKISTLRSVDDAERIAMDALHKFPAHSQTKSQTRTISEINVIKSVATKASDQDTLMYAVNFENSNGFALIAADPEKPAVLALTYKGRYDGNETDCPAFNFYMDGLKEALTYDANISRGGIVEDLFYYELDTTSFMRSKFPEIERIWHQEAPFNRYCINNNGYTCPAGCGAVAIAHAISRYATPSKIDLSFSNAPQDSLTIDLDAWKTHQFIHSNSCDVCNNNALWIREIGEQCNMSYAPNGSSTNLFNIRNCLTHFGYSSQITVGYNINSIINSLDHNKTVIMSGYNDNGAGHAWNTDGYLYHEQTINCYMVTNNSPLKQDVGFETTQNWYLNFIFGTKYGDYDGYFIAWSRFIGEGWRFYEPIDEVTISMFQSHPNTQFVNDIELLTDIAPNN